jgi:hypothetical protein
MTPRGSFDGLDADEEDDRRRGVSGTSNRSERDGEETVGDEVVMMVGSVCSLDRLFLLLEAIVGVLVIVLLLLGPGVPVINVSV